jgi:hypothetical protein
MEIGTVIASTVQPNRDGSASVRMVTCSVSGPTDVRSVQLLAPFGDHSPIPGAKLFIVPAESAWEFGIAAEDVVALAALGIGDKLLAANNAAGVTTAQIAMRGATGMIELNGTSDTATAFAQMKIAFDTLRTEINAAIAIFNTHTHITDPPATVDPPAAPMVPAVADMSAANVSTVKVALP